MCKGKTPALQLNERKRKFSKGDLKGNKASLGGTEIKLIRAEVFLDVILVKCLDWGPFCVFRKHLGQTTVFP